MRAPLQVAASTMVPLSHAAVPRLLGLLCLHRSDTPLCCPANQTPRHPPPSRPHPPPTTPPHPTTTTRRPTPTPTPTPTPHPTPTPPHPTTVLKNLSNLFTLCGDYYFFGRTYKANVWACVALMMLSAICGGITDLSFDATGYCWQVGGRGSRGHRQPCAWCRRVWRPATTVFAATTATQPSLLFKAIASSPLVSRLPQSTPHPPLPPPPPPPPSPPSLLQIVNCVFNSSFQLYLRGAMDRVSTHTTNGEKLSGLSMVRGRALGEGAAEAGAGVVCRQGCAARWGRALAGSCSGTPSLSAAHRHPLLQVFYNNLLSLPFLAAMILITGKSWGCCGQRSGIDLKRGAGSRLLAAPAARAPRFVDALRPRRAKV